uniref:RRM domain-containing protein n=1 Tax=Steinernema glaseri TaxID=37863 RepID=A0A1I7ZH48_9BILA
MATVDGWRGGVEFDRGERKRAASRERERSRSPIRRRRTPPRHERRVIDARNDRMVYLSNIPYDVRWMEIKDLVREKAGEVVFVEVLEDRDGRPKGSAVVEFKNKESVERCVEALHRFEMKGRQVVAKEIRDPVAFFRKVREDTGVDFLSGRGGDAAFGGLGRDRGSGMPPGEVGETYGLSPAFLKQLHIEGPLNNRVFVANLGYNVSCGKLFDVFKIAGKVTWLDLQMDKDGKSKGLAVVQYSHPIEAVQAISMLNGQRLYDRAMTVKMDRFEKEPELREGELPVGLRAIGMGLGANGAPLADVASVVSTVSATANPSTPMPRAPEPYYSPPEPAYQSPPAVYQSSIPSQNSSYASGGAPAAGGYVAQFSKPANPPPPQPAYGASAPQAPSGGYVATGPAPGPSGYNASNAAGAGYGGGYNAYQGSSDSYSVTRTLLIKNLPPDYSWHIVRDRVQQFGAVESCEIVAKGCAKVKYYNLADAERAKVTLQGSTVEGRSIGIEYL